ncbi:MAG: hypothetical protein KH235_07050 [Oscillospiraceae bacterium]|nr:hypothetical protein [Oscillospiraceae bacterium]
MMDELKQQFYEVMHKYQKPFSEEGVTANLTQWSEQKQGLLQLLRRHPIWNEKELAIVFRVEERREIDRITVDETRAAILELGRRACTDDTVYENFETALRAATADYARIPNEYRLDTIRQYGGIKCAPGQKASRIINRLCLKFHLDQIEEEAEAGEPDNRYMRTVKPYNALFARLADALNPAHIEKTAVLSIHPCDFLEMSNRDNTWSSCHCLERGSYHGGCQSYMGDAVSMIFFTVSDEYTQDFHTAPRIVQQAIATCLDKPNLWSIKRGKDTEPYCESAADSNHYPDYEYGYAVVSLLKGETDYGKMTIGSVAHCVCCGGEQKDHRSIRCAECGSMFVCKGCGKTVHGYGRYIDNHFYCKECSYRCTACGEEFIGMPRIGITRSGEQRGICPACYEQVISVCRNCAIHKRLPSHRCQSFLPKSDERPCRIKEESMQELTFETILRLPQMELKKTLKAELKSRGYPITDKPGYLYAEGTIPVLLVAHMDTVHRQPVEQICYSADGAVAMSPQGIGGDDRCGVWMILQILRTTNCHVLFCEDEEVGCIGAKKFTGGSLRPQVNYIVELDRRGNNDAVFYRCDNPEFEDFVTSFGFETAGGSCSDISYIAPYLETAAVNISCGYYCEHQRHEYIHLEEIELNADRVAQMVTQQTEHFEYMEQQDSFFGGRAYQYSMWDTASERDTYKWLSPLPKEAKIKLGTAELILPHAKIDRQGKVHRYVPKLKAAVLTENAIAVMPDGKKARYDFQKAKCQKVMPLSRALEILNTI